MKKSTKNTKETYQMYMKLKKIRWILVTILAQYLTLNRVCHRQGCVHLVGWFILAGRLLRKQNTRGRHVQVGRRQGVFRHVVQWFAERPRRFQVAGRQGLQRQLYQKCQEKVRWMSLTGKFIIFILKEITMTSNSLIHSWCMILLCKSFSSGTRK